MKFRPSIAFLPFCLVFLTVTVSAEESVSEPSAEAETGQWVSLFNGNDLDGWTPKIRFHELGDNFANTFRVEEGLLKVRYDGYDEFGKRFGHLFYKTPFSHYRFRVEYRFVGQQCKDGPGWATRNSGVMIHGEAPETMEIDQEFPVSIEVQLLGGDGTHPRPTANLCTPGTHVEMNGKLFKPHCTNSTSKTYHGEQWVTVEMEVHGNRLIKHIIDGKTVLEYAKPQYDPTDPLFAHLKSGSQTPQDLMLDGGSISLQSESHPIDFRKVEIMPLDEDPSGQE